MDPDPEKKVVLSVQAILREGSRYSGYSNGWAM